MQKNMLYKLSTLVIIQYHGVRLSLYHSVFW